ncbi:hypothetical protein L211DRAFT_846187 [Terfezia boudieri ATCC MYA-4762]|uniref:Uncharacterized protein n=1 Tax=Terfezia boudieri ATCC MYA-4762 TaxID=1051890 RepID=A0A3N4LWU5_9PEZI|nr:hypothetical protein L211DRAFT_846187 [Terfezia boudieri ATCC MYA-4762]
MSRTSAPESSCDAKPAGPHITPNTAKAEPAKLRPVTDLHCYICTPTPSFTNTSHLLTHLASKSHLRTLFEIELCATQCGDEGCTRALEKFHTWYYVENVGEHLVDRFIIKKGKWSREKLKSDAEEPFQEGQENMVNDTQVPRQQEENVMVNDAQALHQTKEEFNERGLAEILIAAMNEDKKRKRVDFSTPTRPASRLNVDGILTPPCTVKGPTARSAGGRKPLASLINEAPTRVTQPPIEEQLALSYTNTPSSESSLGQVKAEEAGFNAFNPSLENEEETDINEGPDRGVIYSSRGPRLRGKIWPGMAVFDGAPSLSFMRTTPSRVFSPSGAAPSTTSAREEKSPTSGHPNEAPSSPSVSHTQGSKPGTILEPSCNSEPSAKRLKHMGSSLELIFQGVDEINAEVDNDSDLDADADYEMEEHLEYILREDLAKTDGNRQLKLSQYPTAASNTTFSPSPVCGQNRSSRKTPTVDVEKQTHRKTTEHQLGQWQPINGAECNRTKHAMAIGSLINEGHDQDVADESNRIEHDSGGIVHVAHHINLDTLNQAYVSLYRSG